MTRNRPTSAALPHGRDEDRVRGDHPQAEIVEALGAGLTAIWTHVPYWKLESPNVPVVDQVPRAAVLPPPRVTHAREGFRTRPWP